MKEIIRGKIENIEISIKQLDTKEGIYGMIDQFVYSFILDNGKKYTTESSLRNIKVGDTVDVFNDGNDTNIILSKTSAKKILKNYRFSIFFNIMLTLLTLCVYSSVIMKYIYEGNQSPLILLIPITIMFFGFMTEDTINSIYNLNKEDKKLLKKYMLGYSTEQIVNYKIEPKVNIKDILKI